MALAAMHVLHFLGLVSSVTVVCSRRISECPDSSCNIEEQFTKPDKIPDGRYQAVIKEDIFLRCLAKEYSDTGAWHVCIRDALNPSDYSTTNCSFATRTYCRHECPVELHFKNIRPSQASTYCCNGTMAGSPTDGICVELEVGEKKRLSFQRIPPSQHNITEGSFFKLICKGSGYPEPTYMWLHNGSLIKKESFNGTLMVNNVTTSDGGFYQCVMKNRFETRQTKKIFIDISMKSVFEKYKYAILGGVLGSGIALLVVPLVCFFKCRGKNRNCHHIIDDRVSTPSGVEYIDNTEPHPGLDDAGEIVDRTLNYAEPFVDTNDNTATNDIGGGEDPSSTGENLDANGSEDGPSNGSGGSEDGNGSGGSGDVNGSGGSNGGNGVNIFNVPPGTVIHNRSLLTIYYFGNNNVTKIVGPMQGGETPNSASSDSGEVLSTSSNKDFHIDPQKGSPMGSEENFDGKSGGNTSCKTVAEETCEEVGGKLSLQVSLQDAQNFNASSEPHGGARPSSSCDFPRESAEESGDPSGRSLSSCSCDYPREGDEDSCTCQSCRGASTTPSNISSDDISSYEVPDNNVGWIDTQKLGTYDV